MRVDFIGGLLDGDRHQVPADVFEPRYVDVLNPQFDEHAWRRYLMKEFLPDRC